MNALTLGALHELSSVEPTNQYDWVCVVGLQQKEEVYMRLGLSRS